MALKFLWPPLTPELPTRAEATYLCGCCGASGAFPGCFEDKKNALSVKIWTCGGVGGHSLQCPSPAQVCSCTAELLLLMLLLWKDTNQDILGPTSGKGHKFGTFWVPSLETDPNWDILVLSSGRTQTRTFWVHPLEKDPCLDILDPSSGKGPRLEPFSRKGPMTGYFGSLLWKDLTQDILTPQAALRAPFLHDFC